MSLLDTRRPRALLVAFCLLVWLPGLFTLPPTDRDESRFAQASKQMIETGDYVRIMNGPVPRNLKPIGIYWLQVPFAAVAGTLHLAVDNPIWPYRLPSVAGGVLAVLAIFETGVALADRRAALLAAGMLASSVILVVETHIATTDAALLAATTVAMAVLARAYRGLPVGRGQAALFWLAIGAGILLKGPITPMVAGLTVITLAVADRNARWLGVLRPAAGVTLMLAVVLPWFIAIGLATHGAFFEASLGGDLGHKLSSGDDAHGACPGFHLLLLPLLAWPASLPVLWSMPRWWQARRDPAARFLLAWIVPAWLVFEAVPTKLPHYTMPLYPAVFLLAALVCCAAWTSQAPSAPGLFQRWAAPALTIAATAILAAGAFVLPAALHAGLTMGAPALAASLIVGWLALTPRRPLLALAAMPLFTMALLGWELPRLAPLWLAPAVGQAMAASGLSGQRLATVGFHEPSLMFLAGTGTVLSETAAEGARALASGQAGCALIPDRDEAAFLSALAQLGLHPHEVAQLRGFNYSRGKQMRLVLYDVAGGTYRVGVGGVVE